VQKLSDANYLALVKTIRQVRLIISIFIAFAACWTPYIIVLLVDVDDRLPLPVHLYACMTAHLHASLNCIIYLLANRSIRDGYWNFISRVLCRRLCPQRLSKAPNVLKESREAPDNASSFIDVGGQRQVPLTPPLELKSRVMDAVAASLVDDAKKQSTEASGPAPRADVEERWTPRTSCAPEASEVKHSAWM
jgi:hypothetical protein